MLTVNSSNPTDKPSLPLSSPPKEPSFFVEMFLHDLDALYAEVPKEPWKERLVERQKDPARLLLDQLIESLTNSHPELAKELQKIKGEIQFTSLIQARDLRKKIVTVLTQVPVNKLEELEQTCHSNIKDSLFENTFCLATFKQKFKELKKTYTYKPQLIFDSLQTLTSGIDKSDTFLVARKKIEKSTSNESQKDILYGLTCEQLAMAGKTVQAAQATAKYVSQDKQINCKLNIVSGLIDDNHFEEAIKYLESLNDLNEKSPERDDFVEQLVAILYDHTALNDMVQHLALLSTLPTSEWTESLRNRLLIDIVGTYFANSPEEAIAFVYTKKASQDFKVSRSQLVHEITNIVYPSIPLFYTFNETIRYIVKEVDAIVKVKEDRFFFYKDLKKTLYSRILQKVIENKRSGQDTTFECLDEAIDYINDSRYATHPSSPIRDQLVKNIVKKLYSKSPDLAKEFVRTRSTLDCRDACRQLVSEFSRVLVANPTADKTEDLKAIKEAVKHDKDSYKRLCLALVASNRTESAIQLMKECDSVEDKRQLTYHIVVKLVELKRFDEAIKYTESLNDDSDIYPFEDADVGYKASIRGMLTEAIISQLHKNDPMAAELFVLSRTHVLDRICAYVVHLELSKTSKTKEMKQKLVTDQVIYFIDLLQERASVEKDKPILKFICKGLIEELESKKKGSSRSLIKAWQDLYHESIV